MVLLDREGDWSPPLERIKAARGLADRLELLGTCPVQVKRLRCCGLPWAIAAHGGPVILFCGQRFCPICRPRWQGLSKWEWWPKIAEITGAGGMVFAGTLTRPPTGGTLLEQKRSIRRVVSKMFDRRQWKGPRGFVHQVGILLVIEIGTEGVHEGLVHVHLLVVSPKSEVAHAAIEWMRDIWLELNPDASPLAQDVSACRGPEGFDKWLSYILKGSTLDPSWDDDRLEAMVQALTDGSHRLTSYGLLHTPRQRLRGKGQARPKAQGKVRRPNSFGQDGVDTCCLKVSTVEGENTSTVDNFSRVYLGQFGLDQISVHRDPEHRMMIHPRKDDHGKSVAINNPHTPTAMETWNDPWALATVVPDGPMPETINRVAVSSARLPALDRAGWEEKAQTMAFEEPPFDSEGKPSAAGAVVVEPDGRLWLVSPTNGFGQYKTTFPKGKCGGMSFKATALKEVFEEAGLQVELFEHLIDVTKTTSRTRYYLARRKGGNPAEMCWEMQSVHLVPLEKAKGMLNQPVDHLVLDRLHEVRGDWTKWFVPRPQRRPEDHETPGAENRDRLDGVDVAMVEADFERVFGALSDQPAQTSAEEGASIAVKKAIGKVGRPITLPGSIGELAKKIGGVGPLAEELGVAPRTIRRWATGGVIPKLPMKMLSQLFKRHAIPQEGLSGNPGQE